MPAFAVVLAAVSALVWGTADYCGGKATRLANAWTVTVRSQIAGAALLLIGVLFLPGQPYAIDFVWGGLAGIAGIFGLVLLYRGLATGHVAVVAPVAAVTSALVPMVVGLVQDQLPGAVTLGGAVCAVIAIGMVSMGPSAPGADGQRPPVDLRLIGMALASGALFGVFFVLLARAHDDSGMWPLVGARVCSIGLGLLLMFRSRAPFRLPPRTLPLVIVGGVCDVGANALYLIAAHEGPLSVVAPVAALYPVSTVLLALAVDRERIRPIQMVGLGLATAALVLTAM